MMFSYFNSDNIKCCFAPIIGGKWSELKKEIKNDVISQLLSHADINNDDIIQKEDVTLLKKLLMATDSLIKDKAGDKVIDNREAEALLEEIKQNTFNKTKLQEEAIQESKSLNFPDAEDITHKFQCQSLSNYDFQVLKTNSQVKHGVKNVYDEITFNTYVLRFHDDKTNFDQEIKINFSTDYSEEKINNYIRQIIEKCNNTLIDLMCNELENLYIAPHSKSKNEIADSKQYQKVKGLHKAEGVYVPKDESLSILQEGRNFDIDTLIHELGHAKDNQGHHFSNITSELFDLITEVRPKKTVNEYHLATQEEMYAELFKDYAFTLEYINEQVNKKYKDIVDRLPEGAKDIFIKELAISIITDQDTTISAILDRSGLSEYKDLFGDNLNKNISIKLPDILEANSHFKQIKKLSKKNPKILVAFNTLMHKIASDYNNPRNAKKTIYL